MATRVEFVRACQHVPVRLRVVLGRPGHSLPALQHRHDTGKIKRFRGICHHLSVLKIKMSGLLAGQRGADLAGVDAETVCPPSKAEGEGIMPTR
jgi:hypothetical protein